MALRKERELINRMPHQRRRAIVPQVAAGIVDSIIDPTHFVRSLLMVSLSNKRQLLVGRKTPLFRHWWKR